MASIATVLDQRLTSDLQNGLSASPLSGARRIPPVITGTLTMFARATSKVVLVKSREPIPIITPTLTKRNGRGVTPRPRKKLIPMTTRRAAYCPAARSTFDACLFELREYGIKQLADPSCRRRLADLSSKQVAELLTVLVRLRPRYPNITDDLLFELGEGVDDRATT
jgi:hypothetical protein